VVEYNGNCSVSNVLQDATPAAGAANLNNADLASVIEGLTGVNVGSLGLRAIPKLESRKKNGTAVAGAAAVRRFNRLAVQVTCWESSLM
jgi:hypothetical protein